MSVRGNEVVRFVVGTRQPHPAQIEAEVGRDCVGYCIRCCWGVLFNATSHRNHVLRGHNSVDNTETERLSTISYFFRDSALMLYVFVTVCLGGAAGSRWPTMISHQKFLSLSGQICHNSLTSHQPLAAVIQKLADAANVQSLQSQCRFFKLVQL